MAFTINFGTSNFSNFSGMRTRRQKFGIGSLIILLLFGVVFAGVGLFMYNSAKIDPSWTRVSGQVVNVSSSYSNNSTSYTPTVQYQANGQTYKVSSSIGTSSNPAIGSSEEVAYDPANPADAKVVIGSSLKLFALLFGGIGVFLLVLAPILFAKSLRRSHDINDLRQTGQKVQGVIVDIQTANNSYNNNRNGYNTNQNSYKIVVAAPSPTGGTQNYISDAINGFGEVSMANFQSQPIPMDVYINPSNPQDYYVDISEIPSLTPERIGELIKSAVSSSQYHSIAGTQPAPTPNPTTFASQPPAPAPVAPTTPSTPPNGPNPPQPSQPM